MPREPRTRITLLLPAPTTQPEFLRLNDVLTELVQLRCQEDFAEEIIWVTVHPVERIMTPEERH